MKLSFSLNHMDAFALSESRFWSFNTIVRSYLGIPVGVKFSCEDINATLLDGTFTVYRNEGSTSEYISIHGEEFDLSILKHAIDVHFAMINLQVSLASLSSQEEDCFRRVRKDRKILVNLLDSVEW